MNLLNVKIALWVIAACMVIFLFSCSTPKNWIPPSSSCDKMEQDKAECEFEANKYAGDLHSGGFGGCVGVSFMLAHDSRKKELFEQCMKAKGYKEKKE